MHTRRLVLAMTREWCLRDRRIVNAILVAFFVVGTRTRAQAQAKLVGYGQATGGAVFETWHFGDGLRQPTANQAGSVRVASASQWSLPIQARLPLGEQWTLDVSTAYARGSVALLERDSTISSKPTEYSLTGLSDVRARATGHFLGDNLLITIGSNVPTGKASLTQEELSAVQVLGAPALGFNTPVLGIGGSATAGIVVARQVSGWAWAVGSSYEVRRSYEPLAVETSLLSSLRPGNVLHLSAGTDGFIGQNGMTAGLSIDVFNQDRMTLRSSGSQAHSSNATSVQLGPIVTADWQLHIAAPQFRDLSIYATDRYRLPYQREHSAVDGSSANYLDAGVSALVATGPQTGVILRANARHQTGMSTDATLSTAAVASVGLLAGIDHQFAEGMSVQPFARAQLGQLKSGSTSSSATGLSVGVTMGRRF